LPIVHPKQLRHISLLGEAYTESLTRCSFKYSIGSWS
jgi:hypothetical protein